MSKLLLLLLLLLLLSLLLPASTHGDHSDNHNHNDADSNSPSPNLQSKSLILAKIWCLIVAFVTTFAGGLTTYFMKWNEGFLVLATHFSGGVFFGTAIMHFLSDSNETFGNLTSKRYPFAFMLACAGYLVTMLMECIISHVYGKNGKGGGDDVEIQDISDWSRQRARHSDFGMYSPL